MSYMVTLYEPWATHRAGSARHKPTPNATPQTASLDMVAPRKRFLTSGPWSRAPLRHGADPVHKQVTAVPHCEPALLKEMRNRSRLLPTRGKKPAAAFRQLRPDAPAQ